MAKRTKTRIGERTRAGYVSTVLGEPDTPDYVVAELRYESPVAFTRSKFAAAADAAPQAGALNQVLEKFDIAARVEARLDVHQSAVRAGLGHGHGAFG